MESRLIVDYVIGGQDQKQRILAIAGRLQCSQGDCRCGIAADLLEQDGLWMGSNLMQLLGDDEAVLLVGHYQRCTASKRGDAMPRSLQHCQFTRERQELLRIGLARQGP